VPGPIAKAVEDVLQANGIQLVVLETGEPLHQHADACGTPAASPHAQLLQGRRVVCRDVEPATLWSITHEAAHGICGMEAPEDQVMVMQCSLLCDVVRRSSDEPSVPDEAPRLTLAAHAWLKLAGRHQDMVWNGDVPATASAANVGIWQAWCANRFGEVHVSDNGESLSATVGDHNGVESFHEDERGQPGHAEHPLAAGATMAEVLLEATISWMRWDGQRLPKACSEWWRILIEQEQD